MIQEIIKFTEEEMEIVLMGATVRDKVEAVLLVYTEKLGVYYRPMLVSPHIVKDQKALTHFLVAESHDLLKSRGGSKI